MKLLPILAMGFLVVAVSAIDKEEAKEMFRNMSQECKDQEKATDEDVETMVNEKYPDSKEGKCLMACMQELFSIVVDKRFSKDGFMAMGSMATGGNEEMTKKLSEIADKCENITHADRCEQAILIGKCMEKEAKERGLDKMPAE